MGVKTSVTAFSRKKPLRLSRTALSLEGSQDAWSSDIHEPGVEAGVQLALNLLCGIEGQGHLGGIENLNFARQYLKSARGLGLGLDCSLHQDHALPAYGAGALEGLLS